jgi:hypothetical protein
MIFCCKPEEIRLICTKSTDIDCAALDLFKHKYWTVQTDAYPFSWGTLTETTSYGVKEDAGLRFVDFELASPNVALAFPSPWHLADLFTWMYRWHPLRHHTFVPRPDSFIFNGSFIAFTAKGERDIYCLRAWMVEFYIPLIWPDLLREAMKIISEIKAGLTSPQSPEELVASWSGYLCEDPKSLSFYKAPGE